MEIWVIMTGTAVLLLMVWGLMQVTNREQLSPEEVLQEAEIYTAYGRKADAIQALERGVARFPDHISLRKKLEEISRT